MMKKKFISRGLQSNKYGNRYSLLNFTQFFSCAQWLLYKINDDQRFLWSTNVCPTTSAFCEQFLEKRGLLNDRLNVSIERRNVKSFKNEKCMHYAISWCHSREAGNASLLLATSQLQHLAAQIIIRCGFCKRSCVSCAIDVLPRFVADGRNGRIEWVEFTTSTTTRRQRLGSAPSRCLLGEKHSTSRISFGACNFYSTVLYRWRFVWTFKDVAPSIAPPLCLDSTRHWPCEISRR